MELAVLCLVGAVLLPACGEGPEAATAPPTTVLPSTTETIRPSPTTVQEPSGEADRSGEDRATVWDEMFGALGPSEEACVRDAVGAALASVSQDENLTRDRVGHLETQVLSCLPTQVAAALFASGLISLLEERGTEATEEQEACLRSVVSGMDVVARLRGASLLLECIPGLAVTGAGDEDQDGFDDYPDEIAGAAAVAVGAVVEGVLEEDSDVDVFAFSAVEGGLYELEVALGTLSDSVLAVYDGDGVELAYNDDRRDSSASRLIWRAPATGEYYVKVWGYEQDDGSYALSVAAVDIMDDYPDGIEGAARMEVGERIEGAVDYEGDVDFFVFDAVEGGSYKFEVLLGTLDDSVLAVHDGDGAQLAYNDDRESSTASYLVWTAPAAGDYFVEVGGYGQAAGSYILAVGASDMAADDSQVRGRAREMADRAAGLVVGTAVEGLLEGENEADFFVFGAVEGGLYELEVVLGTLSDSVLAVYDGDGTELAYNDDRADSMASYLVWTAPAAGDYYVEVSGFEDAHGSYTLTVAAPEAVRLELGEGVEGVLESEGEADFFVFGAMEGELYELEVVRGDHDGATLDLYHPDGVESAYNHLFWRSPTTGDFYLRVSGYGVGAYTLTVSD